MMIKNALQLCYTAHKNQLDKGKKPYYFHPIYVALNLKDENQKIVALLHDVIEDTEITLDDLRREGFSESIIEAVNILTRKKDESYDSYIQRIKSNALSKAVKIEDLKHNSDVTRMESITEKDRMRIEKYKRALKYLLDE